MVSRAFQNKLTINEAMKIGLILIFLTSADVLWMTTHTEITILITTGSLIGFLRIILDGIMIIGISEDQTSVLKVWKKLTFHGLFLRIVFNIILRHLIHQNFPRENLEFDDTNWWFDITWFFIILDLCLRYFCSVNVHAALNELIIVDSENATSMELQALINPSDGQSGNSLRPTGDPVRHCFGNNCCNFCMEVQINIPD